MASTRTRVPKRARQGVPRRSRVPMLVAGLAGAVAFLVIFGGAGLSRTGTDTSAITRVDSFAAAPNIQPVTATVGPDGVQQLSMSLQYPRYEPRLMEVTAGTPVRLSLEAIGEPG